MKNGEYWAGECESIKIYFFVGDIRLRKLNKKTYLTELINYTAGIKKVKLKHYECPKCKRGNLRRCDNCGKKNKPDQELYCMGNNFFDHYCGKCKKRKS